MVKLKSKGNDANAVILSSDAKELYVIDLETLGLNRVLLPLDLPGKLSFRCANVKFQDPKEADDITPDLFIANDLEILATKMRSRTLYKILRKMALPKGPVFQFYGLSVRFADLDGTNPSLAIIDISKLRELEFYQSSSKGFCMKIKIGSSWDELLLKDSEIVEKLKKAKVNSKELGKLLGIKTKFLLVVLDLPVEGYCKKTIKAFL